MEQRKQMEQHLIEKAMKNPVDAQPDEADLTETELENIAGGEAMQTGFYYTYAYCGGTETLVC